MIVKKKYINTYKNNDNRSKISNGNIVVVDHGDYSRW
jgi:SepF-like predicted cell division protein (DUF552 family)